MDKQQWMAVEEYLVSTVVGQDEALDAAAADAQRAGMPTIAVPPNHGKFLQLLALMQGAQRILEVGTLGGLSAIWMARALPEHGRLVTLEHNEAYAEVARASIARAGLDDRVEVRVGAALETLPVLAEEGAGPFDLAFLDADKENNPAYFEWALEMSRPGSVIVVDNVVRGGRVLEADSDDAMVQGVRRLHTTVAAEPRVRATSLQTVDSKEYDGFLMAYVEKPA